ncbi:WD40 repeat-like protein [Pisolithus marmoratus]|nr:WD40 repeat-like protein [Pisolithus marmoratus]
MQDPFFATKKRKRPSSTGNAARKIARKEKGSQRVIGTRPTKSGKQKRVEDEELVSDRTDEDGIDIGDLDLRADDTLETSGDEDVDETPAEKRLRLAKLYLDSVKEGLAEGEYDAAEIDRELVSARLRQDVLEHSGKVHLFIADSYDFTAPTSKLRCKGHRFSVTSAAATEDLKWLFTSGKEGHVNKWDFKTGAKVITFYKKRLDTKGKGKEKASPLDLEGHSDEVLALAVSSDGQYLASAGKDRKICVWDSAKDRWIKNLGGHKDLISALAFRKNTKHLYSASFDRTVKLYDLSVMGYVETLFGHQDSIVSLDALRGETAVTAGARDRTIRYWKIPEESQLVFRGGGKSAIRELLEGGAFEGHEDEEEAGQQTKSKTGADPQRRFVEGSIECVALIDETNFVSGGDTGSICLWNTGKKKPIFTQAICHGFHEVESATEGIVRTPRWITSIACLRYSDMFVSGSWDGEIRIWKLDSKVKSFSLVGTVEVPGVVNSLQVLPVPKGGLDGATWTKNTQSSTDKAVKITGAGVGQEHRLGRWLSVKEGVSNSTVVMVFSPRT